MESGGESSEERDEESGEDSNREGGASSGEGSGSGDSKLPLGYARYSFVVAASYDDVLGGAATNDQAEALLINTIFNSLTSLGVSVEKLAVKFAPGSIIVIMEGPKLAIESIQWLVENGQLEIGFPYNSWDSGLPETTTSAFITVGCTILLDTRPKIICSLYHSLGPVR